VLHTFFQFDDGSCIAFFDARALTSTHPAAQLVVASKQTLSVPGCA
jgi:hypothetical protein